MRKVAGVGGGEEIVQNRRLWEKFHELLFRFICVVQTVKSPFVQINLQMPVCRLPILLKTYQCRPMEGGQGTAVCLKSIFNVGPPFEGFPAFFFISKGFFL